MDVDENAIKARIDAVAVKQVRRTADAGSGPEAALETTVELAEEDNLLTKYGFSSIEALEFLLSLEDEFNVVFEYEDLSEELVSSMSRLSSYISLQIARH